MVINVNWVPRNYWLVRWPPCSFCGSTEHVGGYQYHWENFIRNCTSREAGYRYINDYIRVDKAEAIKQKWRWKLFEANALAYLRFIRQRRELERQILTTNNVLTRALPQEIVAKIWGMMRAYTLRPIYLPVKEISKELSKFGVVAASDLEKKAPERTKRWDRPLRYLSR